MGAIGSFKFRIYPDIKRQSEIDNMLVLSQRLYNKLFEKSIQSYKNRKDKISISKPNEFSKAIIKENRDRNSIIPKKYSRIEEFGVFPVIAGILYASALGGVA